MSNNPLIHRAKLLLLTFTEHLSNRGLDALFTLVLIRSLSVESFGVFAIYQSWVSLFLFFLPNLEIVLYRSYSLFKADNTLSKKFAAFLFFNKLKILAAITFALVFSLFSIDALTYPIKLSALTLALVLPLSHSFFGIYRETLRFELKLKEITVLNFVQKTLFLAVAFAAAKISLGSIVPVSWSILVLAVLFGFIWSATLRSRSPHLKTASLAKNEACQEISSILKDTVLWLHLNGTITAAIQTLDVYFLSRNQIPLEEIAVYSVALKAANFFQILPMPFAQLFTVYLGRKHQSQNQNEKNAMTWNMTLFFIVMVILMYFVGDYFSYEILSFLSRGKFTTDALLRSTVYFRYQLLGVCILIVCYPVAAYINHVAKLKFSTLSLFLPWFAFSYLGYHLSAKQGVLETAQFNVFVYSFCTLGTFLFYLYHRKSFKNP